jgi:hypothetical protein
MVEVSDREQWRVTHVLLLDLFCGRAFHVRLVGTSVVEPVKSTTQAYIFTLKGKRRNLGQNVSCYTLYNNFAGGSWGV